MQRGTPMTTSLSCRRHSSSRTGVPLKRLSFGQRAGENTSMHHQRLKRISSGQRAWYQCGGHQRLKRLSSGQRDGERAAPPETQTPLGRPTHMKTTPTTSDSNASRPAGAPCQDACNDVMSESGKCVWCPSTSVSLDFRFTEG